MGLLKNDSLGILLLIQQWGLRLNKYVAYRIAES